MIDQKEYEKAVETFMMEMEAIVAVQSAKLSRSPELAKTLGEHFATLRDSKTPNDEIFASAFALIDEFVEANRTEVIKEAYALYVDMSGGKSRRHP
jgi:hypothetical protein